MQVHSLESGGRTLVLPKIYLYITIKASVPKEIAARSKEDLLFIYQLKTYFLNNQILNISHTVVHQFT